MNTATENTATENTATTTESTIEDERAGARAALYASEVAARLEAENAARRADADDRQAITDARADARSILRTLSTERARATYTRARVAPISRAAAEKGAERAEKARTLAAQFSARFAR